MGFTHVHKWSDGLKFGDWSSFASTYSKKNKSCPRRQESQLQFHRASMSPLVDLEMQEAIYFGLNTHAHTQYEYDSKCENVKPTWSKCEELLPVWLNRRRGLFQMVNQWYNFTADSRVVLPLSLFWANLQCEYPNAWTFYIYPRKWFRILTIVYTTEID